jgi:hypothetical protein
MVGDAWNVLQRLRSVLSEAGNVAIQPPAQKTFDAEGEALEHALTKSFRIRSEVIKSLCSSVRDLGMQRLNQTAKAIIRTLFRLCGKRFLLTLVPFHVACQGSLGTHRPPIFMG